MRAFELIKEKGVYPTYIGYWHEVRKVYHQYEARVRDKGDGITYSQYCEDLILDRLTGYKDKGFYVDIGANDPISLSNTKKFYDRGWHGINVDPNPHCYKALQEARARDLNLNVGVGGERTTLPFYDFEETEISTFTRPDKLIAEGYHLRTTLNVPIVTLTDILEQAGKPIDFLSIDAEAQNFEILKSHDWRIRPLVICIENDADHDYASYLREYGYKQVATTLLNSFFVHL